MDELKKFLTQKNSKMILLVCCGLCLLFFFLPTISIMGKSNVSALKCLTSDFAEGWWALFFLICPAAAGFLAWQAKKVEPIPGYILAVAVVLFWIFSNELLSLAGLGWFYVIVSVVAIAVPFLASKE